jgi:hypothetical protein
MGLCDRRMGPYFSERIDMIQFPPMETFDDIDRGHITDPRPFVDRATTFITK